MMTSFSLTQMLDSTTNYHQQATSPLLLAVLPWPSQPLWLPGRLPQQFFACTHTIIRNWVVAATRRPWNHSRVKFVCGAPSLTRLLVCCWCNECTGPWMRSFISLSVVVVPPPVVSMCACVFLYIAVERFKRGAKAKNQTIDGKQIKTIDNVQ